MSDLWVVAMAAAGFAGALAVVDGHLRPAPLALALAVAVGGLVARKQVLLCLGVGLLAGALAQRSLAGLEPPEPGPARAEVTLVSDPEPDGRGGVAVDVRMAGRRLRARAHAAAARAIEGRLAGERVVVIGAIEPPGTAERRMLHRHLAGRLRVDSVAGWRPGHGVTRAANGLRRTLASGAEVLPERQRSLLAGLTLGDDRDQPAELADAFQGSGLTHLLAVSGENITFVMVVFAPLLGRLRFAPRLAATLGVLAGFALLTRCEPSVLRATAMAAVAAAGTALGRPATTLRALALGVTGILLVDPLLATSLGFQLSAAGTAGIVVGSTRLERALPGPRWCRAPLAVTLAAQAAVAPLLIAAFGSVPVASIPANLLAAPAAGPVMVWGLTAGTVAGLGGDTVAVLVHVPTRALLGWIEAVAVTTSRWPLGDLDATAMAVVAIGAAAMALGRRRGVRPLRVAGWTAVAAALAAGAIPPMPPQVGAPIDVAIGATAWPGRAAAVVVLDGRAVDRYVLSGVRSAGIRRVDLVVLRTGARSAHETAATLQRRWPRLRVLAPGASPPAGGAIVVGDLRVVVVATSSDRLDVRVEPAAPGTLPRSSTPPRQTSP